MEPASMPTKEPLLKSVVHIHQLGSFNILTNRNFSQSFNIGLQQKSHESPDDADIRAMPDDADIRAMPDDANIRAMPDDADIRAMWHIQHMLKYRDSVYTRPNISVNIWSLQLI